MSKQSYPEEFKVEAVKQITERGHKVADVSASVATNKWTFSGSSATVTRTVPKSICN